MENNTTTEETKTYTYSYPHPAVTCDCVVLGFDGQDLNVLLVLRGVDPYKGCWALPGGFMREQETIEECAIRELREETHLELSSLKQFHLFSAVDRDPRGRVVTMAFYALVKHQSVRGGDDAEKAQWFPIGQLPDLAFDHAEIIQTAMTQIRKDIHFEPIGFDLLDETFTIPQLQRLYEVILEKRFDRRNFQKKMMQIGLIEQVDKFDENEIITFDFPDYYGEPCIMRKMDISELFNTSDKRGRKPNVFRFDKEKYTKWKSDNSFRLEF